MLLSAYQIILVTFDKMKNVRSVSELGIFKLHCCRTGLIKIYKMMDHGSTPIDP